jgi:membrane-bound serine protease (ClpP class)
VKHLLFTRASVVFRYFRLAVLALVIVVTLTACAAPAAPASIKVLRVEGDIVPVVADYLDRGLSEAEQEGARLVVIQLSTPGGLYNTTQAIVGRILNAKVPVAVYVSPAGGWAGSAGTFITLSAHIAAMAPGSRIGAASPVSGEGQEIPETMKKKVTEDAAAWMRSLAAERGRNGELAALAVTEAKSYSDVEALENKLIDFRARDLADLLRQLDGRQVKLADGKTVTLATSGQASGERPMSGIDRFLQLLSNPNLAYILLSLASVGLLVEISNPGLIFPGVAGGICLLLAFYGLGVLNASWGGVALILLSFILFGVEFFVTSHGILLAGGIVALTIGSLVLFSGNPAEVGVDPGLIVLVIILFTAFVGFLLWAVVNGQRRKLAAGEETMLGKTAEVVEALRPRGMVLVEGERWEAELEQGTAEKGEEVVVRKIEGLKLYVARPAGKEG